MIEPSPSDLDLVIALTLGAGTGCSLSAVCQQGVRHQYAVLAESVGAGGQIGVEPPSLFGVKRGEHPLLHVGDGCGGTDEALGAGVGEGEVLVAAGAIALDKVGASQRAQELVHCLTGDERATCECGVGEPGSVGELFQARVLRDGQLVVSQGGVHRRPQGGRGPFEHVAHGRIEIDLTHVNILTYPVRQDIDKRMGVFRCPLVPTSSLCRSAISTPPPRFTRTVSACVVRLPHRLALWCSPATRSRSPSASRCPTPILTQVSPASASRSGSRSMTPRRCMTSSSGAGSRS